MKHNKNKKPSKIKKEQRQILKNKYALLHADWAHNHEVFRKRMQA